MKAWLSAGAAILVAASALAPMAQAAGPRASSENNWPGMTNTAPGIGNADTASPSAPGTAWQYVWQQDYDPAGKLRGHWVVVR
jgi:hypothetical protein